MKPELVIALNEVTAPSRIMLFCVPTRIIRLVDVFGDYKTFRVEQFVQQGNALGPLRAAWKEISHHVGDMPGEALKISVEAAHRAQKDLIAKVQAAARARADLIAKVRQ